MEADFWDRDSEYLAWLKAHPNGYVLNTEPTPKPDYLILHRVSCGHLWRKDPRQFGKTQAYRKVCSMEITELQQWADKQFSSPANLTPCGACKP